MFCIEKNVNFAVVLKDHIKQIISLVMWCQDPLCSL